MGKSTVRERKESIEQLHSKRGVSKEILGREREKEKKKQ